MRPLVSIVLVTYNRADLLRRSIVCYNRVRFPLDRLEIIVVDDGSMDTTEMLCGCQDETEGIIGPHNPVRAIGGFSSAIDMTYMRVRKPAGLWRDCAVNINRGIRAAKGELILCTHPEVMVGRDTLTACCDLATNRNYVCAKPYYLKPAEQDAIDTVDWVDEGPLAVRKLSTFYDTVPGGNADYEARAIESHTQWQSWVFGGHRRELWKRLGGMIETHAWGAVDVLWMQRRDVLVIANATCMSDESLCVHQWHPSPRVHEKWQEEVDKISKKREDMQWPKVDNLWS